MQLKQIILAAFGISLTFLLFFFGKTRFPEGKPATPASAHRDAGLKGNTISFNQILSLASQNLNEDDAKNVSSLNEKLTASKTKKDSIYIMKQLGRVWYASQNYIVAGVFFEEAGKRENNVALLDSASQSLAYGYTVTKDTNAMVFGAEKTLECFQRLRDLQPENLAYKIGYATTLIDGMGDVMNGVMLLKEVEKVEPDNIQMNLILGRLDIRNGELDKSISHLNKVLKKDPENLYAYLYLAEAFKAKGNKSEQVNAMKHARKLSDDAGLNHQLDEEIKILSNK